MHMKDFLGHVQHRARLATMEDALKATRATLGTLGERLAGGEPANLGAQLPEEFKYILASQGAMADPFSSDDFLKRVSEREGVDLAVAVHHARAVLSVLSEAADEGALSHARQQLPEDYGRLFKAGSEGRMSG